LTFSFLLLHFLVFIWGTGTQGQLGLGNFVKSGIRNSFEVLTPQLVDFFEGKNIQKIKFGSSHSAACKLSS
jgi:hypothetical protein